MKTKLNIIMKYFIPFIILMFCNTIDSLAQYSGGNSDGYSSGTSLLNNFDGTPVKPVAIAASSISWQGFNANWSESAQATKYYLDVDDNSDFSSPLSSYNNLDVGNVRTYSITSLAPNRIYYYRVRSFNSNGTSISSNIINLTTLQKALTISGISISNKTYDGNTTATLTGSAILNGVYGTDAVNLIITGSVANFNTKNTGSGKAITVSGYSISGADVGNYTLSQPTGLTADVIQKNLTITGVTANTKVYNGTNIANLSGGTLSGVVTGNVVTLNAGSGTFADKNVGTGKLVTTSGYNITGTDAGNYLLAQPTGLTANITAKSITITGLTASNKVYDGTSSANLSGGALSGIITGDIVTIISGVGTFANKNIGTVKAITVSGYTPGGTDGGNYSLTQPAGLSANITIKSLSITGLTANSKEYDRTTSVSLIGGTLMGVIPSDVVNLNAGTGSFANKNVGTGKAVSVSGYTISGTDAGNYNLTQPTGLTANITSKTLIVTGLIALNKIYNGTTVATLTGGTLSGVISGDIVSVNTSSGLFSDKNIGTGKTVNLSVNALTGTDALNYTFTPPIGLSADITAKSITVASLTATNKVYDASSAANLSGGILSGIVIGDIVTLNLGVGVFADKKVGTAKAITTSGYTVNGTDAANYSLAQPVGLTANITAKTLTITGLTAVNKEYDRTTAANLSGGTLTGIISSEIVNLNVGSGTFANKNVGTAKTITVSGYTISGTDAGNYSLTQPTSLTANITSKTLIVTGLLASNKIYDGSTVATLTGGTLSGVISGDIVTLSSGSGLFSDKNVGTGKSVNISVNTLTGTDAINYTLTQPTGLSADITPKALTITGLSASNKVYDGTTLATHTGGSLLGAINGDIVTLNIGTGSFSNANAGIGKPIVISGYTITGADAGNYTLSQPTNLTANISKATSVISWNNPADIYGGTALSAIQLNATANVPGTFAYTPVSGTVLSVGSSQALKTDFSPTDAINYNAASKTVYINVTPSTGFIELSENKVFVYPNPANSNVTISGLSVFSENKTINLSIIDRFGKTSVAQKLVGSLNEEQLNVENLSPGIYLIYLYTDKERIVKQFIKD